MKILRLLCIPGAVVILVTTFSSCAGDPRKNCNHPQHGQYMMEQRKKKTGF